jgi:lysophospholipase L1-like esterase
MKLNLSDLHQFAVGLDHWEIVDGAWRAHRLPTAMEERYLQQDIEKRFLIRFSCTSCVRLRFVSDTRRLRVTFRYGFEARSNYHAALLVDGKSESPVGPHERHEEWAGVAFEQPTAQQRLFDLWLPHLCQADVVSIEVDDGCRIERAPPLALRWLAYGDSITQGMTATLPTRTVIARCALALNAAAQNVALGSAVFDEWLVEAAPAGPYDLVSIAYGTNDYHRSLPVEQFQQNAHRLLASLTDQQPGRSIVLLTPLTWVRPSAAEPSGPPLAAYRQSLVSLATEFPQVRIVAGDQMIPEAEEWFVDGVHPNDRGFELYAKNLLPHLRGALGG